MRESLRALLRNLIRYLWRIVNQMRRKPSVEARLAHLQFVIKHINTTWPQVRRRHTYLHGMG